VNHALSLTLTLSRKERGQRSPRAESLSVSPFAHRGLRFSLYPHRMRGEGRGEGFRSPAQVAAPLIRPAATFSPPPRKGEGTGSGLRPSLPSGGGPG